MPEESLGPAPRPQVRDGDRAGVREARPQRPFCVSAGHSVTHSFFPAALTRFFLHLPKTDTILYVSLENPDRRTEGVSRLLSWLEAPAVQQKEGTF